MFGCIFSETLQTKKKKLSKEEERNYWKWQSLQKKKEKKEKGETIKQKMMEKKEIKYMVKKEIETDSINEIFKVTFK